MGQPAPPWMNYFESLAVIRFDEDSMRDRSAEAVTGEGDSAFGLCHLVGRQPSGSSQFVGASTNIGQMSVSV